VRGLELSRRFYFEAVRPILDRTFPGLEHAAGLIGPGSETLGYDDETSRDHHWGPRVQLFVRELAHADGVDETLARELPPEFHGFPTSFGAPDEDGTRLLVRVESGPVAHRVETDTVGGFARELLGVDPLAGFGVVDWLVTPSQRLLELTGGGVFVDPVGQLTRLRALLAWYPHDVWLYAMAGHWSAVAELEHLVGRAAARDDGAGAAAICASLARHLMRLALLQERRYPPYAKWLGTAYADLERPEARPLATALAAATPAEREDALAAAYELVAERHNELGVTVRVDPAVRPFWGRPYRVLFADRLADALVEAIADPAVRALGHTAGPVDAVTDNTEVLTRPHLWRRLTALYDRPQGTD
jgi:uncharacterized protein DUF4037